MDFIIAIVVSIPALLFLWKLGYDKGGGAKNFSNAHVSDNTITFFWLFFIGTLVFVYLYGYFS